MPKKFYSERDIEDLAKQGVKSLEINDQVVLTDLAYEKAKQLGMNLVREKPDIPPAAPLRPYLSQNAPRQNGNPPVPLVSTPVAQPVPQSNEEDLEQRIRSSVISRLGTQIEPNLLDIIITRVLRSTGLK